MMEAKDFLTFFQASLEYLYRKKGKINVSDFSRRAGFRSRSYVGELIAGKKGLSEDALKKISRTLRLPRELSKILEAHAYLQFPELRPKTFRSAEALSGIEKLKASFLQRHSFMESEIIREPVVSSTLVYRVYAALGSESQGATLKEICLRTSLEIREAQTALEVLAKFDLVSLREGRFYPKVSQVDFLGLKKADGLSKLIEECARGLLKNKEKFAESPENLFFYSAFSIDRRQSHAIKEKLREAILAVLDRYQVDDGDEVKEVLVAFS